jgi:23S rRNA (cytidine1920-2'-O)/16S rRNA (cytidine1409-2'-O)-methyltransferase
VAGAPADKPARLVGPSEALAVVGPPARFVSRGGEKLDAALDTFAVDLSGRRVLDAGASTGGFTDCCLQRGAASVVAIDVGYGQLHERLRSDPRVEVRERVNVRALEPADIQPPADAVVADLSFISLRTVAPALVGVAAPGADLVWLVKPQFEAGRTAAAAGRGVIRDPEIRAEALTAVAGRLEELGATIMEAMVSPLRGADGNVEFLLHALAPGVRRATPRPDLDAVARSAPP